MSKSTRWSDISTPELIAELMKRDGVSKFSVAKGTLVYDVECETAIVLVVRP